MAADHPQRPEWKKFSEKLRALGLSEDMEGFGPWKHEFLAMAQMRHIFD